ncbi:hypothetical protein TW65_91138 [Stemphylium lycopersici]|nr:hypothetical protein TW65_91138 [Stemphylium lycopersici]
MPLTSLPTEIVEQIASYLDLPSTRSLRLTTLSLTKAISHIFKERFFHQHTLSWTPQSLSTFLAITSHADFSPALRHLIIDATPTHSLHLWRTRKRLSETIAITTPYGAMASPEQRALQDEYDSVAKAGEEATTFFNETRFDIKTLTRCFANLSSSTCAAGKDGRNGESGFHTLTFAYTGLPPSYAKSPQTYCQSSQVEMSRPFISTMSALASTPTLHARIRSISIDAQRRYGAVSIGRLERLAPQLSAFDTAFARLTVLKLHLRDWRKTEEGFTLPSTGRAPFVVRFLAKARNLRKLELSCYSGFEPNVFGAMAAHCAFPALESLGLSVFRIRDAEDLFAFLGPSFKCLREMRLSHVLLCDEQSAWPHVLRRLAELGEEAVPSVGTLHLEGLFSWDGSRMWVQGRQRLLFDPGVDWRAGLLEAMDGVELRASGPAWAMGAVAYPFVGLSM